MEKLHCFLSSFYTPATGNTGLETLLRGVRVVWKQECPCCGSRQRGSALADTAPSPSIPKVLYHQLHPRCYALISTADSFTHTHTHTQHTHPHAVMARQTQSMQQPIIWGGNSLHELMMKLSLNSAELERLELCSALLTDCGEQSRADDVKANLFLSAVQIWLCEFTCK